MKAFIVLLATLSTTIAVAAPVSNAQMVNTRTAIGVVNARIFAELTLVKLRCLNQAKRKALYDRGIAERNQAVAPLTAALAAKDVELGKASTVVDGLELDRDNHLGELRSLAVRIPVAKKALAARLKELNDQLKANESQQAAQAVVYERDRQALSNFFDDNEAEIVEALTLLAVNPDKTPDQVLSAASLAIYSRYVTLRDKMRDSRSTLAQLVAAHDSLEDALDDADTTYDELLARQATVTAELSGIRMKLVTANRTVDVLERQAATLKSRIRALTRFLPVKIAAGCSLFE